jgi:hypothetical protein
MTKDTSRQPRALKAKRFFQNLPTAKSATQAAINAGYSKRSARQIASENLSKHDTYWKNLLDKAGCTDQHLAGVVSEGTSATKVIGYLENKNKPKAGKPDKAAPDVSVSNDFLDTPDWQARAKFSELAFKLKDAFPEAKLKLSGSVELPPDTGTLDQIVAKMGKHEQKKFVEMLATSFGA